MADVIRPAGIAEQILLVGGLRWRLFCNSLRTTSSRFDLLARILVGLLAGVFAAGIGLGFAAAAYALVARGRHAPLAILLWAVFLGWHFLPLMTTAFTKDFDFRILRRFPLRFSAFFLLNLAFGLADPATVAALFWLACMAAGIVLARPDMLPSTVLIFMAFAAMNLVLNRLLFSWLERLLARRRTREALGVLFLVGLLSLQFFGAFAERWGGRVRPVVARVEPTLSLLPPGLAGGALASAMQGKNPAALGAVALLAGYGLAFGLLLRRRLRAQFLGEDLSETQAPAATLARTASAAPSATVSSFALSFLPIPVRAVFGKELRYLWRNSVVMFTLAAPVILLGFLSLSWNSPRRRTVDPELFTPTAELAFPASVAYMFLILAPLAHNAFAYDGRGIQLLFAAPVRFRDVLLGKNLLFGMIVAVETWLVWALVSFVFAPPGAAIVAETLSALLFAALVHLSLGNLLSLYFPRQLEFGVFRRQRASGVSLLIGLGVQVVLIGMAAGILVLTRWFGGPWLATVIFLGLGAAAWQVYGVVLERCTRLAAQRRDVLTAQLCR